MIVRRLAVSNWRNIEEGGVRLGPRANVFFGANGQGKTNFIEAAYFAFTLKTLRASRLEQLVRWGQAGARIEAEVEVGGLERRIGVRIEGGRRALTIDGKPARRDAPALARAGVILFLPEDLLLPRGSPSERRLFLDRAAFSLERVYGREAAAYQRVLRSRNSVLKEPRPNSALLETYDQGLARWGARLVMRRRAVAAALIPRVRDLFAVMHGDLVATIRYTSGDEIDAVSTEADVERVLIEQLSKRRQVDLQRGHSSCGPHGDDLEMTLAGRPAREHASQGQLRSLVLALKLAERANLNEVLGEPPLLLLDDVASELDERRRTMLFETVASLPGQTLVTVTERGQLPRLPQQVDFEVQTGAVSAVP